MTEFLKVENLHAGYDDAIVLHGLDFTLAEGQTLALLGRNDTGKTTLIDTISGATRRHAGNIWLAGTALHALPSHLRAAQGIGWVPQERNIFKSLTVHENLTAIAQPPRKTRQHPSWTPERVYAMFPRLRERRANLGTQLSGGEQQMLAIGRALCLNPRLLLLDEPLEGLAPIIIEELLRALAHITQEEGLSAIIVEQQPEAILRISHAAVVLDHGSIVYQGGASALQARPDLLEQMLGVAKTAGP